MRDRSLRLIANSKCEAGMPGAIAAEAEQMVKEAAGPIPAGLGVKAQLRLAARALGYRDGDWRVRAAWYSSADSWSAVAFEQLRQRYATWKARQDRKIELDREHAAARFLAIAERLEAGDPEFYRRDADALRALARRFGGQDDGEVTP